MAKEKTTAEVPSDPVDAKTPKSIKPQALEVAAPLISSEVNSIIEPSKMPDSYLTVDARMDNPPITVKFSAKEVPELVLEDVVDSSGESGARKIDIPLAYLTKLMGFTALISYSGKSQGQAVESLVKEVGVAFYPASESQNLAPYLLHEKIVHNTPTYDMHDHTGDETVLVPVPPLAKAGDKLYCTAATEQDAPRHVFYTVVYGYKLTPEDAVPGNVLQFPIRRGWLARRKPWRSLTLQCGWITNDLEAQPPAEVDPHLETRLPRNALEIQYRRTAALIVDPRLDLKAPHLRQSVEYNGGWCLNPELTRDGGTVDVSDLDTYADDRVCFFVSGPGFEQRPLGCVTIEYDGDPASVKLSPCIVACLFNQSMTLTYTVAFNEQEQLSPAQLVSVSVPRFIHPNIEEATNGTVDLNIFPGAALATVPVWAYAECSSFCWMWISGEYEDGSAYRYDILLDEPVTDDWKARGVEAPIPRTELQKLADCSEFKLHFSASFCEASGLENAYEFPAQTFKIEQEPLSLPMPAVRQADGSDLTAWNGRYGVDVEVDYPKNNSRHSISVCWKKPDGTCWPLASKPGSTAGAVIFTLPPEAVIESMGKTVQITYTVTPACKAQTSLPLNLTISLPRYLPPPAVEQATPPATQKGILDLSAFFGDAVITVPKWWFMRVGHRGWLQCTGIQEDGTELVIKVMHAEIITAGDLTNGLSRELSRLELTNYVSNVELTFEFKVTVDGSTDVTKAIVFPLLKLIFRKRLIDETNFDPDEKGWNGWERGRGAADPRDLALAFGSHGFWNGYWLRDWSYTDTKDPATDSEKLFKTFNNLEVGRSYQFLAWVCNDGSSGVSPLMALTVNRADLTEVIAPGLDWELLGGTFKATSNTARLSVDNRRMGFQNGNDFRVTWLRLYEV
ncbi:MULTISPECIES: hypothetical protein [Pseudomonas]|jgi:hypothetical protein|uniref:Uncharacterized protein n=1 Tax=Pseudomonas simiae TaxID=321846 RepID=A0A1N7TZN5_9PSED|nr:MULTISPECIES: hypothetical protein [Pseudomonas]VVN75370.1 hypothetical protein PS706_00715 [Pseudomonas fluorescens]AIB37730.1 hypothetical protein PS417_19540 [Pseudomonas simiae]AJP53576.1 hypothetical protein PF1751_v1c38810 [Pseudomonas simiae]ERH61517.1 hypothetical protein O204_00880 [Pseudomonas simiae]KIQ08742.1 hypothetical protein RU03_20450 [Pseudomonas simiae]